jgi:asparagine synthase (glutamine-hydrolysing)
LPGYVTGVVQSTFQRYPLALAFQGNLYNGRELFTAEHSKTSMVQNLLHLYMQEGLELLQRLRGEFALALWDGTKAALHLATDRFRVHPLFYYQDHYKLVFASRMQGIMACPLPLQRTLQPDAIVDVVASSFIPTPKTIFREVQKLPPGHVLTYHRGETRLVAYWDINFLQTDHAGEAALARKLKTCFAEAVAIRLQHDRESKRLGAFLSGGIDSSTTTGVLTQLTQGPIKTFAIGFAEQRFNEIDYARIVARAFGAEHHEYFVSAQDTYDVIPSLLEWFDEPYGNASTVPTYFCAKMAREHGIEVLYAGDGGDELFAGNERYATQRLFDYYQRLPTWCRQLLVQPLVFAMADMLGHSLFVQGKKYIQRARIPYPQRLSAYGLFETLSLAELLEDDFRDTLTRDYDPAGPMHHYYFQAPAANALDRQLYIDLKLAISDNDLFKVTRMTEAAGVAVRFPFLDHRLAEVAATVPATRKMRGTQLRSFFKRAYADLLPLATRTKQKHGFGLPISVWLRTDRRLNEMMHDLMLGPASLQRGYFRKRALETLVTQHQTDATSFYGTVLWNLMMLELWHRRYWRATC